MPNFKTLWRPDAFGAVGAGFVQDDILRDGIHIRWNTDYRLGLPYESMQGMNGQFRVYFLNHEVNSVYEADLFNMQLDSTYAVRSNLSTNPNSGMRTNGNQLNFWKRTQPNYFAVFWLCQWRLRLLRQSRWRYSREERDLLRYAEAVLKMLRPNLVGSMIQETGEACAVDVRFLPFGGSGTPIKGDVYLNVIGLDRRQRRVVQDWVGIMDDGSLKRTARLRAAGIASVLLESVKGKPAANLEEVRWILCEDYCQDDRIWDAVPVDEFRFNTIPDYHQPDVTEQIHYQPFQAMLDFDQASNVIMAEFVGQPDIQQLFDQPNVYEMTRFQLRYDESDPNVDLATTLKLPLLQNLVAAGVDPVMARIMGHYFYSEDFGLLAGHDIKVEAALPFFQPDNLTQLDKALGDLVKGESASQFFWDPQGTLLDTQLCGLVLAPEPAPKPLPYAPDDFTTTITINDVPSQTDPADVDLMVGVKMKAPVANVYETRPYLAPVAYEVERSISGAPFVNVLVEEETTPDALDEIGIVPPVYFPRPDSEGTADSLTVLDDFRLPTKQTETVQYRLKAYDIFGRPSHAVEGPVDEIALPCHAPAAPANISSRVVADKGTLFLELTFSLAASSPKLQAIWQNLEIMVHRLPTDQPEDGVLDLPQDTKWPGPRPARKLVVPVAADHSLQVDSVTVSCVRLQWLGLQLLRLPYTENDCAPEFPDVPPQFDSLAPPAMDPVETGFRTYQLRLAIGEPANMTPDEYRWCARLRIEGSCPESGATLYSNEPSVASDWLVTPRPPLPVKPLPQEIPVSTHPDRFGDSYFTLDLASFGLNTGDMVKIYQARIDRVITAPANFVIDGQLQNTSQFEQEARLSKRNYELVTPEPVEYRTDARFHSVKVAGNLREYHVLGVIGANQYMEERDWSNAAIVLFTTPQPAPLPRLNLVSVEPFVESSQSKARLTYTVDATTFTDPANPPKIQVLRRDRTANNRNAVFIGEASGAPDLSTDGDPIYRFQFTDNALLDWHRYTYETYLLVYAAQPAQYLKTEQAVTCEVVAPWNGKKDPFGGFTMLYVGAHYPTFEQVWTMFEGGEFDFTLTKVLDDGSTLRIQGALRNGAVIGLDPADVTLLIYAGTTRCFYRMFITVRDVQNGYYVLRLTTGQNTWSKRSARLETNTL